MKLFLMASVVALAAAASPANAGLVYDSSIIVSAQGFGNAHRLMTMQAKGSESGCVTVDAGAIAFGNDACLDADIAGGNGVANTGGDEANPLGENQKHGIPKLGGTGIASAEEFSIIFNTTDPAGNSIDLTDVTAKIFNGDTLVFAIDGNQYFADTDTGNGSAGFVFRVSADMLAAFNAAVFNVAGWEDFRVAVEASAGASAGGPESFRLYDLDGGEDVPEPGMIGLLGLGLAGIVLARRRKA